VLVRLFLLHESLDATALFPASGEVPELLAREGSRSTATVAIQPWRGFLVCHDWLDSRPEQDYVVPVSSISALLAHLTVRRPIERALDLGTGSGVQSLLAARHAQSVVATDLSPRALRLAQWSLALCDVENVDLRRGDLFAPVGEETFDLIVSNPPFIVSPDRSLLFRDAEPDICRKVVEGAAEHLRDGGFAHALCQWPLARGEEWDTQPRSWVAGNGCDAWLLRVADDEDPVGYAANWNRYPGAVDLVEHERALARWVEHFRTAGVERIAFGLVSLRRRSGPNWVRSDKLHAWPTEPAGDHVTRIFEGQTLVEALESDEALLDLVLAPAAGLRLDETRSLEPGGALVAAQVRIAGGVAVRPRLSEAAIAVLRRLDGRHRLWDLQAERAVPHLRELVALGFLESVG
jgi:methylase of polypeptide subunit release factors